jgi:hypothetical protein
MTNKCLQNDSPVVAIKNESTRQRWELFHRAIAHAKQSNVSAMQEADASDGKAKRSGPILSIAN